MTYTYKINFEARIKGAIGKLGTFTERVQAESEDKAKELLYDNYEHIRVKSIKDVTSRTELKRQRRTHWISIHVEAIQQLADMCGGSKRSARTISDTLRRIEHRAHADALRYCNGDIQTEEWCNEIEPKYRAQVQELFNGKLEGLKINGDARGYSLKIADELMKEGAKYGKIKLQTDWGGYGLLAPEITGN